MTPLATALPENSNDGYVAAAYIAFFALVLIYVAIMAVRLRRMERSVRRLRTQAHRDDGEEALTRPGGAFLRARAGAPDGEATPPTLGRPQERERV